MEFQVPANSKAASAYLRLHDSAERQASRQNRGMRPRKVSSPKENIMPKSIAGKNPISRLFTVLLPPLNKFILKTPRKLRPKRITINPEIKFTAPLYSRRILPMVPANAPIATKTTVNPLTNPNAPDKVFFCTAFSTTCKIGDIDGQHGKQAR